MPPPSRRGAVAHRADAAAQQEWCCRPQGRRRRPAGVALPPTGLTPPPCRRGATGHRGDAAAQPGRCNPFSLRGRCKSKQLQWVVHRQNIACVAAGGFMGPQEIVGSNWKPTDQPVSGYIQTKFFLPFCMRCLACKMEAKLCLDVTGNRLISRFPIRPDNFLGPLKPLLPCMNCIAPTPFGDSAVLQC